MNFKPCKLRAAGKKVPASLAIEDDRVFFRFRYFPPLIQQIKLLKGAKWHGFDDPPLKLWSVPICRHNEVNLNYMLGQNVFARYDAPLPELTFERPLYDHQREMVAHILTRQKCILAAEMGTGKTLAVLEAIERAQPREVWYVAPRGGILAVNREIRKWDFNVPMELMTYEKLVKTLKSWSGGDAPDFVVYDESSKIKTPGAQRSQAAMHLADAVREFDPSYIVLMTGTPAPRSPVDWWHQTEVAYPGFLVEGSPRQLIKRLAITELRESPSGAAYNHIITWKDDPNKCETCGEYADHMNHRPGPNRESHKFKGCVNEVHHLSQRLRGLVLVKFKKDCLNLPEVRYEIIRCTPTPETVRAAKLIKRNATRAIEALTLLRELSDGFQYTRNTNKEETCPNCQGKGQVYDYTGEEDKKDTIQCALCEGTGRTASYERVTDEFHTKKDDVLSDLLDEYSAFGRCIIWASFTATIDKLTTMLLKEGWCVLRVDGRGFEAFTPNQADSVDVDTLLDAMDRSNRKYDDLVNQYPKVCFIGHPASGGMALTLTSSPVEIFYSNPFDGESRFQAEARFHRAGMDENICPTIIDLIHLPTDQLILDNLKQKKRLQSITLDDIGAYLEHNQLCDE